MEFIDIPTEQTTAITDAIMGFIAIGCIFFLKRFADKKPLVVKIWQSVFLMLSIAAFLGFWAHGFKMTKEFNAFLWFFVMFALSIMVALFIAGVYTHDQGEEKGKKFFRLMLGVGTLSFVVIMVLAQFIERYFIVFIAYEFIAMMISLGFCIKMTLQKKPGMALMLAGILLTILAAVLQATRLITFTLVWEFDHNSVYHFVQMIAVLVFARGIKKSVLADE